MSLLPEIEPHELLPEEAVVGEWFVSHTQGNPPARGKLALTGRRLVFSPQKMGALIKTLGIVAGSFAPSGEAWSTYLSDIIGVSEEPPSQLLTEEGRFVSIERRWGLPTERFFVLTSMDTLAPALREAIARVDARLDAHRERWSLPASCVQDGTAVGGTLSLVSASLVFLPSSFEKKLDALLDSSLRPLLSMLGREAPVEAREIALADIAEVGKLESELSLESALAGGLRDRLRIQKRDGTQEVFVVSDLDAVIERVRRAAT